MPRDKAACVRDQDGYRQGSYLKLLINFGYKDAITCIEERMGREIDGSYADSTSFKLIPVVLVFLYTYLDLLVMKSRQLF